MKIIRKLVLSLSLSLSLVILCYAHESRPLFIEITETAIGYL